MEKFVFPSPHALMRNARSFCKGMMFNKSPTANAVLDLLPGRGYMYDYQPELWLAPDNIGITKTKIDVMERNMMLRLGPPPSETREMDLDDIFFSRLKLMIIMAKAYLAGYPMGEHRSRAMLENAQHIEIDAGQMGAGQMIAGSIQNRNPTE